MEISQKQKNSQVIRFSIKNEKNAEVGRAFLYIIFNEIHEQPYGYIEDVFIDKKYRDMSYGTKLIQKILKTAKEKGCYKVVASSRNSRYQVHNFYLKLGFLEYGKEFRVNML